MTLRPLFFAVFLTAASAAAAQPRVTFTRDVAPIIFEHCASCHRPGEIAPFSLLTYEEVRPRAAAIARATRSAGHAAVEAGTGLRRVCRRSPPDRSSDRHHSANGCAAAHSKAIGRTCLNRPHSRKAGGSDSPISWSRWPSRTVLPASGGDVLRNFVVPLPLDAVRYVRGIEFRPGNPRVVHHANMRIDRTGAARRADEADRDAGFDGLHHGRQLSRRALSGMDTRPASAAGRRRTGVAAGPGVRPRDAASHAAGRRRRSPSRRASGSSSAPTLRRARR